MSQCQRLWARRPVKFLTMKNLDWKFMFKWEKSVFSNMAQSLKFEMTEFFWSWWRKETYWNIKNSQSGNTFDKVKERHKGFKKKMTNCNRWKVCKLNGNVKIKILLHWAEFVIAGLGEKYTCIVLELVTPTNW